MNPAANVALRKHAFHLMRLPAGLGSWRERGNEETVSFCDKTLPIYVLCRSPVAMALHISPRWPCGGLSITRN